MKSNLIKYSLSVGLILFLIACSVKKDKFINRNFHAVTTEYNVLYNGNVALDKGLADLKTTYQDNFWEILPVERMPKNEDALLPGQSKNPNFERAEEKAVKAIQKHSMNIAGTEKNPQMDEAYLLLAKARYYDNRFIPSLEALNYILYKYPLSDRIYHAKVWREKVNIRLDNDEVAIKNLKKLLEDKKISGQDLADANAMLTQAYMNIQAKDSAIGGKDNATAVKANTGPSSLPPGMMGNLDNNSFYFYNPVTVEYGKKEFATKWGKRELKDNWKWSNLKSNNSNIDSKDDENMGEDVVDEKKDEETTNPLYTVDFYLKQIPTDKKLLDSLAKDRNFAYYQLGLIYKEKFRENELAASRLEQLLKNNPEERLILPAKYNLYKIYQIISPAKAELIKQQILAEYPTSRYAEIVKNPTIEIADETNPEAVFKTMYKKFENNQVREVSDEIDEIINRFTGEESVAKFELLKAKVIGRLQGLDEYKKALNFVALTYPNIEEGKQAESLLKTDIPK